MAQLKELIKEYKEEFVDNSSEYEQICQIIHNDLICDLQEFKKVANDSRGHFHDQFSAVESLKNEIRWFKPASFAASFAGLAADSKADPFAGTFAGSFVGA